uniref:Dehydrogenase/reductase (SDR family) member 9 n=1 Tax=Bursaphelenchus xylophilus TaxID=6326 RepID=A0A1I7SJM0_BURXY
FGQLGAVIVLWDINETGNTETLRLLTGMGVKARAYTVDLADKEQIYSTAEKVKNELGDVYLVMNNAGVVCGKDLVDLPDKAMELTIDVNVKSLFYVSCWMKILVAAKSPWNFLRLCTVHEPEKRFCTVQFC